MQKIILILWLSFLGLISHLNANDYNLPIQTALKLSSDQQIQSQRLAKVYVALCNNVMEPKFYQERDAAIETFDEQLHQLSLFTPTEKIKTEIKNVREIWKEYKKIAGWSIKKDAASKLLKLSTTILQATKALTAAYYEYEKTQTIQVKNSDLITINQYIKQNKNQLILIQRIMLYYLSAKQGIDAAASGHSLHDAQKAFASILSILEKAKITSKSIQTKLQFIRDNWTAINQHLVSVDKDQSYIDAMFNQSDLISATIKDIIVKYHELGVKLNISYSINEGTSQSMLIQQIAKSYIASINDHISYNYKKTVLEQTDYFEKKMSSMTINASSEEIKQSIKVVKTMWKNYKNLVTDFEAIDELRAIKVLEQSHVIMAACDRVSDEIENYALKIPAYQNLCKKDGHPVDPSLDITLQIRSSGNLKVYAQRLALYFMMKTLNLDSDLSSQRLEDCINDFQNDYKQLTSSRLNSPAIRVLLENCNTEWEWIQSACKNSKKEDIDLMLEQTKTLTKKLTKLTNLYEHRMNDFFAEDIKEESPAAQATPNKD